MKKTFIFLVGLAVGYLLMAEYIKPLIKESKATVTIKILIQGCAGNTYTLETVVPKNAQLKINNNRVAVPELNVYNSVGNWAYGPIALNACSFTVIDTIAYAD